MLKKRNNLIFNHIGIFVKNIKISEKHLSAFIEKDKSSKLILDKKLGIKAKLFYDKKKICYELVEPYGKNNPVSGFLKRGTNILNHVAYTVRDIHEVFGGGLNIDRCGWKTIIGPGRHPVSSAYFWYVENPAGGLAEYFTDEDYCTDKWEPRNFERSNENFAEWAIADGINGNTRRQHLVKN